MGLFKKKTDKAGEDFPASEYGKTLDFSEVFGDAAWIMADDAKTFGVFRKSFDISAEIKHVSIDIVGFGTFVFYVNGRLGTEDLFLPLNSDFEERHFPPEEEDERSPDGDCSEITSALVLTILPFSS